MKFIHSASEGSDGVQGVGACGGSAMAAHLGSDGHPAKVAPSHMRVKFWDDKWYSKDEVLDWCGAVQGQTVWDELRTEKERCGVQAWTNGVVYLEEAWLNWASRERSGVQGNDLASGSGSAQPPGLERGADGDVASAAQPRNDRASGESSGVPGMASGSGSVAQPDVPANLPAALRQAAHLVAETSGGQGTGANAMAGMADAASAAMPPTVAAPATAAAAVLFTADDLAQYRGRISASRAAGEQRRLRAIVIGGADPLRRVDMTATAFDWRAMLKSLPGGAMVVGDGVTAVFFRLLPLVMDQNYVKHDSGERHVFEIVRADASRVLLHFHKKGPADPPEIIPGDAPMAVYLARPDNAGALSICEPPMTHQALSALTEPGEKSAPLGRNEATMALQTLLNGRVGVETIGSINITDGRAFPWTRFLKNQVQCLELVGPGIERVYAARLVAADGPVLLICRSGGSYVKMPVDKKNANIFFDGVNAQWRNLAILQDAWHVDVTWMQLRNGTGFAP